MDTRMQIGAKCLMRCQIYRRIFGSPLCQESVGRPEFMTCWGLPCKQVTRWLLHAFTVGLVWVTWSPTMSNLPCRWLQSTNCWPLALPIWVAPFAALFPHSVSDGEGSPEKWQSFWNSLGLAWVATWAANTRIHKNGNSTVTHNYRTHYHHFMCSCLFIESLSVSALLAL